MHAAPGSFGIELVYGDHGDHDDHINSFSPTSRFCERAGFAEEWVFRYSTPLINRLKGMPVWATRLPPFNLVAESIVYPPKATRCAVNNSAGYRFRSMFAAPDSGGEETRH